jgi:hypothetical protein
MLALWDVFTFSHMCIPEKECSVVSIPVLYYFLIGCSKHGYCKISRIKNKVLNYMGKNDVNRNVIIDT